MIAQMVRLPKVIPKKAMALVVIQEMVMGLRPFKTKRTNQAMMPQLTRRVVIINSVKK